MNSSASGKNDQGAVQNDISLVKNHSASMKNDSGAGKNDISSAKNDCALRKNIIPSAYLIFLIT